MLGLIDNPLELLKLIEKPMHENSLQAAAIKYHGLSIFSLGALKILSSEATTVAAG